MPGQFAQAAGLDLDQGGGHRKLLEPAIRTDPPAGWNAGFEPPRAAESGLSDQPLPWTIKLFGIARIMRTRSPWSENRSSAEIKT